jgi:hypothetical protein
LQETVFTPLGWAHAKLDTKSNTLQLFTPHNEVEGGGVIPAQCVSVHYAPNLRALADLLAPYRTPEKPVEIMSPEVLPLMAIAEEAAAMFEHLAESCGVELSDLSLEIPRTAHRLRASVEKLRGLQVK